LLIQRIFKLLQIKTRIQLNLRNPLFNLCYLLFILCNLLSNLSNLLISLRNLRSLLSNNNLYLFKNQFLDPVAYKNQLTNMIYDLVQISITRSSTQASSRDAENFDAKPKPW
jgi:hypothetical protein